MTLFDYWMSTIVMCLFLVLLRDLKHEKVDTSIKTYLRNQIILLSDESEANKNFLWDPELLSQWHQNFQNHLVFGAT